jgi:predicted ATPase/DNA-binding winged helix-turn-helix (wHTH) protein
MLQEHVHEVISFGPFRVFPVERQLKRGDEVVNLGSRAFDILLVLLEHAGEVVGHKELITRVWPGVFVEEVALRVHIAALRKSLGSAEAGSRHLMNVPGRGYSFVAPTTREAIDAGAPSAGASYEAVYRLPLPLARMVGRDDVVCDVRRKILVDRFVTIVGPGGMGKTTVALSVARSLLQSFRGVICFVELGPLSDPNLLAGALASALGLPVRSQDPLPDTIMRLRARPALLILDSAEHLITETALIAERLFVEVPTLHLLVTSREILRAERENVYRLPPLDSPPDDPTLTAAQVLAFPAAKLFLERAASRGGPLTLQDADAPIVGKICRKLDGIALAIELAAGRVGISGLHETAMLLDSQFALRWPGRRTAAPRHQTLSATLDWSYNLLLETERMVLRQLSVFVSSYRLHAARRVAAKPGLADEQVFDALEGLSAKSLASADRSESCPRYRLLDTTRTYASVKLAADGEQEHSRRRHAEYYRDLLQQTARNGDAATEGARASAEDLDDIRAAMRWAFDKGGDLSLGVDLAILTVPIWLGKALFSECQDWMINAAAAVKDAGGDAAQRELSIQLALASTKIFTVGLSAELTATWTKALELAESLGDVRGQLACFLPLWGSEIRAAAYGDALRSASKGARAAEQVSDPGPVAMAEWMLGRDRKDLAAAPREGRGFGPQGDGAGLAVHRGPRRVVRAERYRRGGAALRAGRSLWRGRVADGGAGGSKYLGAHLLGRLRAGEGRPRSDSRGATADCPGARPGACGAAGSGPGAHPRIRPRPKRNACRVEQLVLRTVT